MTNKNNKGLGRGIEALFQEFDETNESEEVVTELKLADIRPNPYQPRKTFDEKSLAELTDSIKKTGVFQPIIVRKSTVKGYEIIAGERRFRASKLADKETIPAIVREIDEASMMEIAVLENLQREDLTPLEEAEAYNTLMEKLNLTQNQVSERLGKSRPYIANYLRLLGLPLEVKQMLQTEKLSMGQARTLLALKNKKQLVALAQKTVHDNLTVRQLEQLIAKMNGKGAKKGKKVVKDPNEPYYKQSETALQEKFGTKVAIKNRSKSGKGKIEIDYLSTKDFNRILDILGISLD
ncbi:chromosome (plasmid) partitioning protein ParB [Liquorilactobacillus sucicola DSM 21376 = JCM 15457]|uniref:Chromosome partitioning protein, DNA-binding protein n=1 Tax=Liquorilactobacillus sucicola DSM 21376 = JCM 15457 TaxID=1423806 RepID=A0A023CXS1_9LACO|nr:ParB/RepB/Spo0J family partition protein [Liquorilactobacillus sucicola]KRN06917.1 chromosome partitioning protein, DNA-binding protein [Liquorilactobacillus sucicola DSM 21376 = JCM 15457]GAJ26396.1 chromosome (plasmid) partitioning protein ParB [Liquorilactobacillus sucicola DSM 21376 = JCM 15457]